MVHLSEHFHRHVVKSGPLNAVCLASQLRHAIQCTLLVGFQQMCDHLQALLVHESKALSAAACYALYLSGVLSKPHTHVPNVGHAANFGIQLLQPCLTQLTFTCDLGCST